MVAMIPDFASKTYEERQGTPQPHTSTFFVVRMSTKERRT